MNAERRSCSDSIMSPAQAESVPVSWEESRHAAIGIMQCRTALCPRGVIQPGASSGAAEVSHQPVPKGWRRERQATKQASSLQKGWISSYVLWDRDASETHVAWMVLPFSSVSPLSGLHLSWLLRWAIAAEFLACSLTSESNAFTVSLILWELYAHVFLDKSWQLLTAERYTNKKVLSTDLTPNLPLAVICQAGHLWTSAKWL